MRSLRRLRRRATDGHPRDMEGSSRSFQDGLSPLCSSCSLREIRAVPPEGHGRLTSITPGRVQPSVSSVLSVRNPSPSTRAVIDLNRSDLPEPSNHLGCPSVAPEGETAERVARGGGLPAWDGGRHRCSTSITPIEGLRPTFRSLRRLRRRATDGHPRDVEGSGRSLQAEFSPPCPPCSP